MKQKDVSLRQSMIKERNHLICVCYHQFALLICKLHMRRANYVATIFNSTNLLQMNLDSPLKHGWDKNLAVVWSNIVFPGDISDMLFAVVGSNEYEGDDESSGNESPEECLSDSSASEESDIDYY